MMSLDDTKQALECCFQYACCVGCPQYKGEPTKSKCLEEVGISSLFHLLRLEGIVGKLDRLEDDLR